MKVYYYLNVVGLKILNRWLISAYILEAMLVKFKSDTIYWKCTTHGISMIICETWNKALQPEIYHESKNTVWQNVL